MNTKSHELTFFSTSDGKKIKSASSLKDTDWSSTTCPLVWSAQGLHGDMSRHVTCVDRAQKLLASGDARGEVRLHRFPCVDDKAQSLRLVGHGSEVSALRFNSDGSVLYTVGAKERVICQWRVRGGSNGSSESTKEEE